MARETAAFLAPVGAKLQCNLSRSEPATLPLLLQGRSHMVQNQASLPDG